jgi:hypothetical protein
MYGDINDPESTVSKAIAAAEGHVYALKDFGNKPSGRYILRNADWIDMLPQEFVKQGGYHHGK